MKVYVNNQAVHIYGRNDSGTCLLTAGVLEDLKVSKRRCMTNGEMRFGLDGVLTEEARIYVREG